MAVSIQSNWLSIGYYAFYLCLNMEIAQLDVKKKITIDYNAFDSCSSLYQLAIIGKEVLIGTHAFHYSRSIQNISIIGDKINILDE